MSITFFVKNNDEMELNVANGNVKTILYMLGKPFDYSGRISVDSLEAVWGKLQCYDTNILVRKEYNDGNIIHCGLTKERIEYYYYYLDMMLVYCMENKREFCWA